MESIENILTFEVKREIAERYFGFRKIIEEDTNSYLKTIEQTAEKLEKEIGHDLVRIVTLLDQETLVHQFFTLTGLPERLFLDSHLNVQPSRQKIFINQKFRGITRKGCLHNMFFDAYKRLHEHVIEYRKSFAKLDEFHQTICEQIKIFYRKNDIHSILGFLRSLDPALSGSSTSQPSSYSPEELEKKLRIDPPSPVAELLPDIPAIPAEKTIRRELKTLVTSACLQQPQLDLRRYKNDRS